MAETPEEFTFPVPDANAAVEWLGFSVTVDFYPDIKISRKTGLEFTAELTELLEPKDIHLEDDQWEVTGGGICEGIALRVRKDEVYVLVSPVSTAIERYENRISTLLQVFEQKFEPKLALHSNVDAGGLVALPNNFDSRVFLGGHVMLLDPKKFDAIDRPLDVLGVRLYFPPSEAVDWSVNVRIESWSKDPKKVLLAADADWDQQARWDSDFVGSICNHITDVSTFMSQRLVQFLREPSFPDLQEEDEDDR